MYFTPPKSFNFKKEKENRLSWSESQNGPIFNPKVSIVNSQLSLSRLQTKLRGEVWTLSINRKAFILSIEYKYGTK